jgi:hypothetical protein
MTRQAGLKGGFETPSSSAMSHSISLVPLIEAGKADMVPREPVQE